MPVLLAVQVSAPTRSRARKTRRTRAATDDDFLTPEQCAEMLSKSVRTLEEWRRKGTGPVYFKRNRSIWYDRAEVKRWRDEGRAETTEDTRAYTPAARR